MTRRKPVVIDLDTPAPKPARKAKVAPASSPVLSPAEAPPVPDTDAADILPTASAEVAVRGLAQRWSIWTRLLLWLAGGIASAMLVTALWDFAAGMAARHLWLGYAAWGALAILGLAAGILVLRELAAIARMRRVDRLRSLADGLRDAPDLAAVTRFTQMLTRFYRGRQDLRWALAEVSDQTAQLLDGDAARDALERTLLSPLDKQAEDAILHSSRQVAVTTAIVPLALADVVVALAANLRMIRRIAEIYGGRAGGFGSWRLARAVAAHLVATGAVAIGDDLIGSVAGGSVLSKLSRRFGEGLVNGALTARVGVAAMEVCRPMPFDAVQKPRVTALVRRALTGVFGTQ